MTTQLHEAGETAASLLGRYDTGRLDDLPSGKCWLATIDDEGAVQTLNATSTTKANRRIPVRRLRDGALIIRSRRTTDVFQFPRRTGAAQ